MNQKYFKFTFSLTFVLSAFFAPKMLFAEDYKIDLLDKSGNIVGSQSFFLKGTSEGVHTNERMKMFWFCFVKKTFSNLTCKTNEKIGTASHTQDESLVLSQQLDVIEPLPSSISIADSSKPDPTVVYQIVERAVPGPAGPAGRDGRDGVDYSGSGNFGNQFLAQYSTSPTYSAQYNGFGVVSNSAVNPTGDASLNTISGAGLVSCNGTSSKLIYNSSTKQFECGTDLNTGSSALSSDIVVQNIFGTTTIKTPNLYASTSNASTSNSVNLNSTLATFTSASSTNLFSNLFSAISSTITDILFTNATGTNATTTNFATTNFLTSGFSIIPSIYGTNATFTSATITTISNTNLLGSLATLTSATITNIFSTNATFTNLNAQQATFSYATVTNGFFTNLSVTGPVQAALTNGYVFRGGTNNYSEATSSIFIANDGKVGVGSTTPSEKLSVQGNLLVSGNIVSPNISGLNDTSVSDKLLCISTAGVVTKDSSQNCFSFYSDENLKKNITNVDNALEKVKKIRSVNFNWIDESRGTSTQIGYIAQEVEKVFPEVVKTDEAGLFKINYIALSAIYANAIKELDTLVFTKINEILSRLSKNEEDILNLKTRVNDLENKLGAPIPTPEPSKEEPVAPETTSVPTEEAK